VGVVASGFMILVAIVNVVGILLGMVVGAFTFAFMLSAWKSSPKTAKKPRLNQNQTSQDQKFPGTNKDCNCGLVFSLL